MLVVRPPLRQLGAPDDGGQAGPGTVGLQAAVKQIPELQPSLQAGVGCESRHLTQLSRGPERSEVEGLADLGEEGGVTLPVGGELLGGIVDTVRAPLHCLALAEAHQEFLVPGLAQVSQAHLGSRVGGTGGLEGPGDRELPVLNVDRQAEVLSLVESDEQFPACHHGEVIIRVKCDAAVDLLLDYRPQILLSPRLPVVIFYLRNERGPIKVSCSQHL